MRHITGIVCVAGGAAAAECTGRDPPVQSVPRYPGTEVQRAVEMVTEYLDI